MLTSPTDASLVAVPQHRHLGTAMPSGGVHPIAYGLPLLRMTFDFSANDRRMSGYLSDRAAEIGRAVGGVSMKEGRLEEHYNIVPYQTTHNTGGAIMGATPADS